MTKPVITKRTVKGAALTYNELDTNFQNLADATVSLTAGSGGTKVTSDLNGNITLIAGTNITLTGNNTTKQITINANESQNVFSTIAVAGQSSVVADSTSDTLTLVAGTGITLTTNASTDTVTITNSSLGANAFGKIVIAGQSDVDADSTSDTLTLAAGSGITLTTNASTDTVTISSTVSLTPAGSNQQIQFNNGGAFGASAGLIYDGTSLKVSGNLESLYQSGDEGGEIYLNKPVTNTSITNGVTIDVYQNKVRIFEAGGTNRGGFFDITSLTAGANTNLGIGGSLNTNTVTVGDSGLSAVEIQANTANGISKNLILRAYNGGSIQLGSQVVINPSSILNSVPINGPVQLYNLHTTTDRSSFSPQNGMIFYNSTTHKFQGYANGSWVDLH